MGAAYFIVLDNTEPGFDPFVNGKAVSREAARLSDVAKSLGLKSPDEYFSMSADEAGSMAAEFDVADDVALPAEQWFPPEEGLTWVAQLRGHLRANPSAVADATAVLSNLAEYERVLSHARRIGAKWHFAVDF